MVEHQLPKLNMRGLTNLSGTNLNSRVERDWPRRGGVHGGTE